MNPQRELHKFNKHTNEDILRFIEYAKFLLFMAIHFTHTDKDFLQRQRARISYQVKAKQDQNFDNKAYFIIFIFPKASTQHISNYFILQSHI